MRSILCALVAFAPLTGVRAQPEATPQVEQARRYFDAGKQAYESGQYVAAINAFDEAYALAPRPQIVFSGAQAARRQYSVDRDARWLKRALTLYRQYLVEVPQGGRRDDAAQYVGDLEPLVARLEEEQRRAGKGEVQAMPARAESTQLMVASRTTGAQASVDGGPFLEVPVVKTVKAGRHTVQVTAPGHFTEQVDSVAIEGRLVVTEVALREKPAVVTLTAPAGADIAVDGRPAGEAPLAVPLELTAGRHFLAVTRAGYYPFTQDMVLRRGEATTVEASLERTTQRTVAWGLLGGGALLIAGGGVTTGLALSAESDAQAILDDGEQRNLTAGELRRYGDLRDDRDAWRDRSIWLYGAGAAIALTGALLYFIDTPRVVAPPPAPPVPEPAPVAPADMPD